VDADRWRSSPLIVASSKIKGSWQAVERSGAGKGLGLGSGGGLQGDLVAECLKVADVVADGPLRAAADVVEVGAEVDEVGLGVGRCQTMTRMERPTATMAFCLPRRRAMRRYRSPRKVSVLPAEIAASPTALAR